MPILSALHIEEGEQNELTPHQIKGHLYEQKYKGKLFCTTLGCNAKLVFVQNGTPAGYFRTWKYEHHIEGCVYRFHREIGRIGIRRELEFHVEASPVKKGKAMDEAFAIAKRKADKMELIQSVKKSRKSAAGRGAGESAQVKLVLFEGIEEEEMKREGIRSPRILKRDALALKDSDVGRVRLVYGVISDVEAEASRAVVRLDGGNKAVHVRFDEAFFAINPMYEGLFHYAKRYCEANRNVIFTGYCEVRSGTNGDYELFVYQGRDLKLQNTTLLSLADYYASGIME
ncbi:MAG: hypothetical protein ACXVO1_10765 [Tumebacillaceae bacterium]